MVTVPAVYMKSNQNVDVNILSRNTTNTVNALGKIFDKKTVEEKQELAQVFAQEANQLIHDISARERGEARRGD
jgi:hypothetical protein